MTIPHNPNESSPLSLSRPNSNTCTTTAKTGQDGRATGLKGPLPTEIGLLSSLQVLDIGNNRHTGVIPSELGQLSLLQHIAWSEFVPTMRVL